MNRIIRQASLIGLFVIAVTIGANAQSDTQYRAEIPFDFEARGKHYEAGNYSVGPLSQAATPGGIAIRDIRNRNARILGVVSLSGDNDWDKPGILTFVKVNGRYTLSQISTATFTMKLKSRKSSGELARQTTLGSESVAIALSR